jgi:sugar phosphate isomerase/epimerase
MLAALDRHGLKMIGTYVVLQADTNKCSVPTNVVAEVNALKGRDTVVWLCVNGRSTDDIVLAGIRQLADLAATNRLRVAIYPHFGSYTDTETTALRLATQSGRTNVGVSFNLCHFLRQNDEAQLERTLREIAPRLFMVSVNGADRGDTRKMDWNRLIQPLGAGDFDVARVLRVLDEIGYAGPVGLQCYRIKQPSREHLSQSMKAWRALSVKPGAAAPVPQ